MSRAPWIPSQANRGIDSVPDSSDNITLVVIPVVSSPGILNGCRSAICLVSVGGRICSSEMQNLSETSMVENVTSKMMFDVEKRPGAFCAVMFL